MVDPTISIKRTLIHEDSNLEGKVTKDTGGLTRWGISQKAYPVLDIKNLSLEQAIEIYKKDYFCKMKLDKLTDQLSADLIFDMGVNMGTVRALSLAREAALSALSGFSNSINLVLKSPIDLINKTNSTIFLKKLVELRKNYYITLVQKNEKKYSKYLKGWLNRAESYLPKDK